jgi:hypothetical protein
VPVTWPKLQGNMEILLLVNVQMRVNPSVCPR